MEGLIYLGSKSGNVLNIEPLDFYTNWFDVVYRSCNIRRFPNNIEISSLDSNDDIDTSMKQKIIYSKLNQCRKCRRFKHFAKGCTIMQSPMVKRLNSTSKILVQCKNNIFKEGYVTSRLQDLLN
jgi:hypothetical protein